MAEGGSISPKDIKKMQEKAKPAAKRAFNILEKFKKKKDRQRPAQSTKPKEKMTTSERLKEKIVPKKKMERLKELKEMLK